MKRPVLIMWIVVVLTILTIATWFLFKPSNVSRQLTRAEIALQADQNARARELAQEYIRYQPDDWQGHYIHAKACLRLGQYQLARRALLQAAQLNPTSTALGTTMAETYMLPAIQSVANAEAAQLLPASRKAIEQLQHAHTILDRIEPQSQIDQLSLEQMRGINSIYMANVYRQIAELCRKKATVAKAAMAYQKEREFLNEASTAASMAETLGSRAIVTLCNMINESKKLLSNPVDSEDTSLEAKLRTAANSLVQLCIDTTDSEHWQKVQHAIQGLDDYAPVAVALVMLQDVSSRRFSSKKERLDAISTASERIEKLVDRTKPNTNEQRQLLLAQSKLALAREDYDFACKTCDLILKDSPSDSSARFIKARILLAQKEFAKAEQILFVLKTNYPNSPEIAFTYASVASATGKHALAVEAMRHVVELSPQHAAARQYLIEDYVRNGYTDQAFQQAREYYRNHPDDPTALRMLAETAKLSDHHQLAVQAIEDTIEKHPDRPDVLVAAAEAYARLGNQKLAQELVRKTASRESELPTERLAIARAKLLIGQTDQAETLLVQELHNNPDLAQVHAEIAKLYQATKRLAQAEKHYRMALKYAPLHRPYQLGLADVLFAGDKLQESLQTMESITANPQASLLRARIYKKQKNFFQAQKSLEEVTELIPNSISAYDLLVDVLNAQHKPIEALTALERMGRLGSTGQVASLIKRIQVMSDWGLDHQAKAAVDELLFVVKKPNDSIHLMAARVLANLGQFDQARKHLEQIQSDAYLYPVAQRTLAQITNNHDGAISILSKLVRNNPHDELAVLEIMKRLSANGQDDKTIDRFHAFLKSSENASLPEEHAIIALNAMFRSGSLSQAYALARQMQVRTNRTRWDYYAWLANPESSQNVTATPSSPLETLILISTLQHPLSAQQRQKWQTHLQNALDQTKSQIPPRIHILATAIIQGRQAARELYANHDYASASGITQIVVGDLLNKPDTPLADRSASLLLRATLARSLGIRPLSGHLGREVLKADPSCQWALLLVAESMDSPLECDVCLHQSTKDSDVAMILRAEEHMQHKRYLESARIYSTLAERYNQPADLLIKQAIALEKAGTGKHALALYRKVIEANLPAISATAANNAAFLLSHSSADNPERLQQAYQWSVLATENAGHVPDFRDTRGWLAYLLGRTDEAALQLRIALSGNNRDPNIHNHLSIVENKRGNSHLAQWHATAARHLRQKDSETFAQTNIQIKSSIKRNPS